VIVIEHNLDVIKSADWLIDLGPEGGDGGGEIIATGTPEDVAAVEASHTGHFLKRMLSDTTPGTGHNTSGDHRPTGLPPKKDKSTKKRRKPTATNADGTVRRQKTSS